MDYVESSSDVRKADLIRKAAVDMRNDPQSTQLERQVMDELLGLPANSLATLHDALIASGYLSKA